MKSLLGPFPLPLPAHVLFRFMASSSSCPLWFAAGVVDTKLPPQAVSELVALSDELDINEVVCVDLWSQVKAMLFRVPPEIGCTRAWMPQRQ